MVLLLVLTQRILRGILRGLTTTKQQPISFTGEIVGYYGQDQQEQEGQCFTEEGWSG
jgi:hypothetical protein